MDETAGNFTFDRGGPYFNQSWEYYKNSAFAQNMSDANLTIEILERCSYVLSELNFDNMQMTRVIVTWILFVISAVGNGFVLYCVCRKSRTSHVHLIMLHFAVADLAFTFLVMPKDAMWNATMQWLGGDILCRICQMSAQMGMYISSFMVVVTALDRCCSILLPMATSPTKQRRRTKYLVGGAWILSILSAIPTAVIFGVITVPYCPHMAPFSQCIDASIVPQASLRPYYFFTMAMSFLFPMTFSVLFYSLVICEISNMMRRDRERLGRRDSTVSIMRARKKTLKITGMVMLSFLLFWGPYYGFGIYNWFNPKKRIPKPISTILFLLMYFHPAIHPFIYGILMKDVRDRFKTTLLHLEKIFTCSTADVNYNADHLGCFSSPEKERYSHSNGYVLANNADSRRNHTVGTQKPVNGGERDRLISANSSEDHNKQCGDRMTPEQRLEIPDPILVHPENNGVVARASTVSFRLPDNVKVTAEPGNGNVLNNNNIKEVSNNRDDNIINSTNV